MKAASWVRHGGGHGRPGEFAPRLDAILLLALFGILVVAGGASRADALGQAVVRASAWGALAIWLLLGRASAQPPIRARAAWILALAIFALPLLQLIPLPPALWLSLPGRLPFAESALLIGEQQPWRPWSLAPDDTFNAASSLVVPLVTFLLATRLGSALVHALPWFLVCVGLSAAAALLQVSGRGFDNPLVNDTFGMVSGSFANRNHFALFTALGILAVPVWALHDQARLNVSAPVAVTLVILFALLILASGSRFGLALGALALVLGFAIVRVRLREVLGRYPSKVRWAALAAIVGAIAGLVLISVLLNRAASVTRVFEVEVGTDMRTRGLPVVLAMVKEYLPVGSGLGGFDAVFRMHEPANLLRLTYFNHAHNDFLEVALDTGVFGLILIVGFIWWWGAATYRVLRSAPDRSRTIAQLGSAMLFMIALASAVDYPARTPLIMATIALAAAWLSYGAVAAGRSALPREN